MTARKLETSTVLLNAPSEPTFMPSLWQFRGNTHNHSWGLKFPQWNTCITQIFIYTWVVIKVMKNINYVYMLHLKKTFHNNPLTPRSTKSVSFSGKLLPLLESHTCKCYYRDICINKDGFWLEVFSHLLMKNRKYTQTFLFCPSLYQQRHGITNDCFPFLQESKKKIC